MRYYAIMLAELVERRNATERSHYAMGKSSLEGLFRRTGNLTEIVVPICLTDESAFFPGSQKKVIGRSVQRGAAVVMGHPNVSGAHAEIYSVASRKGIEEILVMDLGSTNGTNIYHPNGQLKECLSGTFNTQTLKFGDWIILGTGKGINHLTKSLARSEDVYVGFRLAYDQYSKPCFISVWQNELTRYLNELPPLENQRNVIKREAAKEIFSLTYSWMEGNTELDEVIKFFNEMASWLYEENKEMCLKEMVIILNQSVTGMQKGDHEDHKRIARKLESILKELLKEGL